jgi:predicted metal-dependent phosphoesterase TrpH
VQGKQGNLNVDLHTHTNRSDGTIEPRDLVRLAKKVGLDVLGVTDHDTIEALEECGDEGARLGVRIVPGVEISTRWNGEDIHVLGYGIDPSSTPLKKKMGEILEQRRVRVERICGKLGEMGVTIQPERVIEEAGDGTVGRKHVAKALLRAGAVRSIGEAFDKYLGTDAPANIPPNEMSPAEASAIIADHGGIPVFAHPGFLDDDAKVEKILDESPLRGIEVYHRYESPIKHLAYLEMARRRDLLVTGGSDFHGDKDPRNAPLGHITCPPEHWKLLKDRLDRVRSL